MSLLSVNVSGKIYIVEAANKGTAKAWGRGKLEVIVEEAKAADVVAFLTDGNEIETLVAAPKKAKEGDAPDASATDVEQAA